MTWSYEMVKLYRQKWQCIRDENGRIVAWCAGYSDDELKNLLKRHPDGISVVLNLNNPKI